MALRPLNIRKTSENEKLAKSQEQLIQLLQLISQREINEAALSTINVEIDQLNAVEANQLNKQIRKSQQKIIQALEKECKIVTINHYRNTWMVIGISIGVGIGTALGTSLENMAFVGVGIPIGMGIGLGIGRKMDRKANEEGRQLGIELK